MIEILSSIFFSFISLSRNASSLYPKGPLKATTYLFSRLAELLFTDIYSNKLLLFSQSSTSFTTAGSCLYRSSLSYPCCFSRRGLNLFSTFLQKDRTCSLLSPYRHALMILLWKNQNELTKYAKINILI